MATIYETLRLVPIVRHHQLRPLMFILITKQTPVIPKQSAYDTKFTARTADGNDIREFRVPLGTGMVINVPALHYNRKRRRVSDRTGLVLTLGACSQILGRSI